MRVLAVMASPLSIQDNVLVLVEDKKKLGN